MQAAGSASASRQSLSPDQSMAFHNLKLLWSKLRLKQNPVWDASSCRCHGGAEVVDVPDEILVNHLIVRRTVAQRFSQGGGIAASA